MPALELDWADAVVSAAVVVLCVAYGGVVWQAGVAGGVVHPLGSDGPIWFECARKLSLGLAVHVPPLYPRLVGWLGGTVSGAMVLNAVLVGVSMLLSALSVALVAPSAGTRRAGMLVAPLLVVALADPATYAWSVHPEPLITAALVGCGAAAVAAVRWPGAWTSAALGLACGVALGAKEHGLVVSVLAPVVAVAPGRRGAGARLVACLLALSPFVLSQALMGTLFAKAWVSVQESLGWLEQDPSVLEFMPIEMTEEQQRRVAEGGLVAVNLEQMWQASRTWWPAYGLGIGVALVAAIREDAKLVGVLALPLATLLPAVLVWTEPRHYLVVAPAAVALGVGAAVMLAGRAGRAGVAVLVGSGVLTAALAGPGASARVTARLSEQVAHQRAHEDEFRVLAWLTANLDPDDRVLFTVDPVVIGKSPFLPILLEEPIDPAALPGRAWFVAPASVPAAGWTPVQDIGALRISVLPEDSPPLPARAPRPVQSR